MAQQSVPAHSAASVTDMVSHGQGSVELVDSHRQADAWTFPMTVRTASEEFRVTIGGALVADFLFAKRRTFPTGTPLFLLPGSVFGYDQNSFAAHARASKLSASVLGPDIGPFQSGGEFLTFFFSETLVEDRNGIFPFLAYGYLRNESWQFAAGLQRDIFSPVSPTMLVFTPLFASGNTGAFRGQLRVERYWHPSESAQTTFTIGLSDPVTRSFNDTLEVTEDNGWPNVEWRIAVSLSEPDGKALPASRQFELGFSGVVGQMRNTPVAPPRRVVANIWGLAADFRFDVTDRWGIRGEFFTGQTLGRYNAAGLQDFNAETYRGVHVTGGWGEFYYHWHPALHSHFGYGIDDPLDGDLAPTQQVRNETYFANLIWDATRHFRVGVELTYRMTAYTGVPNNEGLGVHTQFQWQF